MWYIPNALMIVYAPKYAMSRISSYFAYAAEVGLEEDRVAPLPPFQVFLDKKKKNQKDCGRS